MTGDMKLVVTAWLLGVLLLSPVNKCVSGPAGCGTSTLTVGVYSWSVITYSFRAATATSVLLMIISDHIRLKVNWDSEPCLSVSWGFICRLLAAQICHLPYSNRWLSARQSSENVECLCSVRPSYFTAAEEVEMHYEIWRGWCVKSVPSVSFLA